MRLYKYMKAEYAMDVIRTGMIKVSTLADVNDPDEFMPSFRNLSIMPPHSGNIFAIPDAKDQFRRGWCSEHGFISLSASWDNNAMWGMYGDKSHGIALRFEVSVDEKVFPVKYNASRASFTQEDISKMSDDEKGRCFYGQKGQMWLFEQEWRRLVNCKDWVPKPSMDGNTMYFWNVDASLILTGVILGPQCMVNFGDVRVALQNSPYPDVTHGTEIMLLQSDLESYALRVGYCDRYENGVWRVGAMPHPM